MQITSSSLLQSGLASTAKAEDAVNAAIAPADPSTHDLLGVQEATESLSLASNVTATELAMQRSMAENILRKV